MNLSHSCESFFENEFYPLFFDHNKFLLSPANTPIFQLIATKKADDPIARKEALSKLKEKIENFVIDDAANPDMSFALGYGSADDMGTTSGQITSMQIEIDAESVFASWIGAALGIGVQGGENLLIDSEDILWSLFEGWFYYRKVVSQVDEVANKIDTWNGQWLAHRLSTAFDPEFPEANFQPFVSAKNGLAEMKRPSWITLLFLIANKSADTSLVFYAYKFGQTNSTIGFIPVTLKTIRRFSEIYTVLFGSQSDQVLQFWRGYEGEFGFKRACQNGEIGIRQFEPKDYRKWFKEDHVKIEKEYIKSPIKFNTYYSWILAMLDNKEILVLAEEGAVVLHKYLAGETRAKTVRSNNVDSLLGSKSKREFIEKATKIIESDSSCKNELNKIVECLHLEVPTDSVNYFIALLKFKFSLN